MSEATPNLFTRVLQDLWNAKNPQLIAEIYAENYVFHSPIGDFKGHTGYREIYDAYTGAFPDCRFDATDMSSEGDRSVVVYTFSGTHQGELMGVAPTGTKVSIMGIASARISGGKIVEEWAVWDQHGIMQQIGAIS